MFKRDGNDLIYTHRCPRQVVFSFCTYRGGSRARCMQPAPCRRLGRRCTAAVASAQPSPQRCAQLCRPLPGLPTCLPPPGSSFCAAQAVAGGRALRYRHPAADSGRPAAADPSERGAFSAGACRAASPGAEKLPSCVVLLRRAAAPLRAPIPAPGLPPPPSPQVEKVVAGEGMPVTKHPGQKGNLRIR